MEAKKYSQEFARTFKLSDLCYVLLGRELDKTEQVRGGGG